MEKYIIQYREEVVKKHLPSIPKNIAKTIKRAIEERLAVNPVSFGKALSYDFKGYRRLRVGDYRIVYLVKNNCVIITGIRHRKDVYKECMQ